MKNIFVIGLEDFNLPKLRGLYSSPDYQFHGLLDYSEVKQSDDFNVDHLLEKAEQQIRAFPGSVDGIIGYWDFPVSLMQPILCRRFNLPGASLESALRCEHKFWSRTEQRKVIPSHVPDFNVFDPFDDDPLSKIALPFPFWVKPVKSFRSYLGFRIENGRQFEKSTAVIREKICRVAVPFNAILKRAQLPEEIACVDGEWCLAEEIIGGYQCTVCGYAWNGEVTVYGIVDSIRENGKSSFSRYQYPSQLPARFQKEISEAAARVILHVGLNNSAFNIEFFHNEEHDHFHLLEVNTRISESHCDLFEKVDGASDQKIIVDLSLGRKPEFPCRQGSFQCAGKFFLRRFQDARVVRVPSQSEIGQLKERFPGLLMKLCVREGMKLSELRDQDSYSFELADIYLGAQSEAELLNEYEQCVQALAFEFE
jgi:hypothetical protein